MVVGNYFVSERSLCRISTNSYVPAQKQFFARSIFLPLAYQLRNSQSKTPLSCVPPLLNLPLYYFIILRRNRYITKFPPYCNSRRAPPNSSLSKLISHHGAYLTGAIPAEGWPSRSVCSAFSQLYLSGGSSGGRRWFEGVTQGWGHAAQAVDVFFDPQGGLVVFWARCFRCVGL